MATAHEIQAMIEEQHAELNKELVAAITERDRAMERVKAARAAIEAAPRLHVKRRTKPIAVDGLRQSEQRAGEVIEAEGYE